MRVGIEQETAAFWRDTAGNRAKESELLCKELKDARAEAAYFRLQFRAYRIWAWWWFSAAIGLAVALAFAL